MGTGGQDFGKLALLHVALGFQVFAVNMSQGAWYGLGWDDIIEEKGQAIQAFLIIAFMVYCVTFVLSCLLNFGDLKGNKIVMILTLILACVAAGCIVIGIAIYGSTVNTPGAYSMTAYVMAAVLAGIGAIFMIVQMVG